MSQTCSKEFPQVPAGGLTPSWETQSWVHSLLLPNPVGVMKLCRVSRGDLGLPPPRDCAELISQNIQGLPVPRLRTSS